MSDEQEYIYGVEEPFRSSDAAPVLKSRAILKETAKRVEIKTTDRAFDYKHYFRPAEVARTPLDAWLNFARRQGEAIQKATRELERAERLNEAAVRAVRAIEQEQAEALATDYDERDAADDRQQQELDERGRD